MDYTQYRQLEFRRKFFKLLGASIDVKEPETGKEVGFIELKAFKLREDVRLFSDRSKSQELLRIQARSIIDFGVTYDVFEGSSETQLFSLKRKGLKSTFIRDHWEILDATGDHIGSVQETSSSLGLVRRYVDFIPFIGWAIDLAMSFWPLTYSIFDKDGTLAGKITHHKNPIVVKMTLDQTEGKAELDPRVNVAVTTMLSVVDADKN